MAASRTYASSCSASRAPARERRLRGSAEHYGVAAPLHRRPLPRRGGGGHPAGLEAEELHGPRRARARRDRHRGGRGAASPPAVRSRTGSCSTGSRAPVPGGGARPGAATISPSTSCSTLDVPTEIVLDRIAGRRVCEDCGAVYHVNHRRRRDWTCDVCGGQVVQRDDDTEEAIARGSSSTTARRCRSSTSTPTLGKLVVVDGVGVGDEVPSAWSRRSTARFDPEPDGDHPQEPRSRSR